MHAYEIQEMAILRATHEGTGHAQGRQGHPQPAPGVNQAAIRAEAESRFADIPGLFAAWVETPIPDMFSSAIDNFEYALEKLFLGHDTGQMLAVTSESGSGGPLTNNKIFYSNEMLRRLADADDYLESWTGKAAQEFKSNFLTPFPSIVYNQFQVVAALKAALEAEREIWNRARNDIDTIAHHTLNALDGLPTDENVFSCHRNTWEMTFTVVGAVASIPAAVATGGAAVLLAVVAGGAATAAVAGPPPTARFAGETADAVISAMRDAITALSKHVHDQERVVAEGMAGLMQAIDAKRSSFVSPRPQLAGATAQNVTGPLYMGYTR
jgi:hypothetical protein